MAQKKSSMKLLLSIAAVVTIGVGGFVVYTYVLADNSPVEPVMTSARPHTAKVSSELDGLTLAAKKPAKTQPAVAKAKAPTGETKLPGSALPGKSFKSSSSLDSTASVRAPKKVSSTTSLLDANTEDILVENPFATSLISKAGEEMAIQRAVLQQRSELADEMSSFLDRKIDILEKQQKIRELGGTTKPELDIDADAQDNETSAADTNFKLPGMNTKPTKVSTAAASSAEITNLFRSFATSSAAKPVDLSAEIASSKKAAPASTAVEVSADEEPLPVIDVAGIVSSSSSGSILLLKDGQKVPLREGAKVGDNWRIQSMDVTDNEAWITFETNDHSETYRTSVPL